MAHHASSFFFLLLACSLDKSRGGRKGRLGVHSPCIKTVTLSSFGAIKSTEGFPLEMSFKHSGGPSWPPRCGSGSALKKKKHVAFSSVFPRRGSIHVMHLKTCATGSKHAQQFLRLLSGPLSATPSCGLFPAMPPQVHTVPQFQPEAVGRRWEDGGGRQSDQRVPVSHFTHDQMPPATKETAPGATHTSSGSASVRMCSRSGMAAA